MSYFYLSFYLLVFLTEIRAVINTDFDNDPNENTRQFILQQNDLMKQSINSNIHLFFKNFSESFNQNLLQAETKILSELLDIKNLLMSSKAENSAAESVGNTVRPRTTTSNSVPFIPISGGIILEKLDTTSGRIALNGLENSDLHYKIWTLGSGSVYGNIEFQMKENNLGPNAHLSIFSPSHENEKLFYQYGFHDNSTEVPTVNGDLILIILTVKNQDYPDWSFVLNFESKAEPRSNVRHSFASVSEFNERATQLSFPNQNRHHYDPQSVFYGIIAPANGQVFTLTARFLDVLESPNCQDASVQVFFIEETETRTTFQEQLRFNGYSSAKNCGSPGQIFQPIGHTNVAVIRFRSNSSKLSPTGRGFMFAIDP